MISPSIVESEVQKEIDPPKGQWKTAMEPVIQWTEVMRKIATAVYEDQVLKVLTGLWNALKSLQ